MKFTLPVIGGNLFQLFYTLADSMIVGKTLGASSLAAVGATSIIVYFVLCFIQGMTNGFGIYLGQKAGEGKLEEIKKGAAASLWLSLVFTAVITVMFCGLAHPILKFMNTPEDIYNEAYEYMFIVLLGSGATFFLQYDIQYTAGSWRQPDAPVLSGIFLSAEYCSGYPVYCAF